MPFKYLIAAFAALLVPELANAYSTLNPVGGNSWDFYVFGNGRVIYDILTSVKMLMTPDAGSTGFNTLLVLLATLGFLVMAISAGFDPGKNLLKMFQYIMVVWAVSFCTTTLTANVTVNDLVVNSNGSGETYVVSHVPALVAMPAAITSEIGYYFTKAMETYFTITDDFKVTGAGAGQFNLFNKLVEESNEYGFKYPELKRSIAAYTADCVVPALATNRLSGPGYDENGNATTLTGQAALLHSTNLMQTYASAQHNAIMTTYYPVNEADYQSQVPPNNTPGQGAVVSCADAYNKYIMPDMTASAQALINQGTAAWSKTGVLVTYETAMRDMLTSAASNNSVDSGFTSPNGYILQQSFINSMSGNFREAAMQTGNNEVMQAAAIGQAEAQQISSWVAAFETFNNMMGYVFTVLQAFIFAITPMIVVALLVPGLGRAIFANYAQILVWMTLWMPTLALINYIMTLVGSDSSSIVVGMNGGISMANKGIFNEKAKNSVVAAQFLGTMTPMLTWGIVKGAMAFTEFISHGVGSQFAASAGTQAATGNLSMNNMSMDNVSTSKYNTAFSSSVGFQATNAFDSAGSLLVSQDGGGATAAMNGGSASASRALQEGLSSRISESKKVSNMLNDMKQHGVTASTAEAYLQAHAHDEGASQTRQALEQAGWNANSGDSTGKGKTVQTATQLQKGVGEEHRTANSTSLHAEAGVTAATPSVMGLPSLKGGAGVKMDAVGSHGNSENIGANKTDSAADATKVDHSDALNKTASGSLTSAKANSESDTLQSVHRQESAHGRSFSDSLSTALAHEQAYTSQLERAQSLSQNFSANSGMTMQDVNSMLHSMDAMEASMMTSSEMQHRMDGLESQLTSARASTQAAYDAGGAGGKLGGGNTGQNWAPVSGDAAAQADAFKSQVTGNMAASAAGTRAAAGKTNTTVDKRIKAGHQSDNSLAQAAGTIPGVAALKSANLMHNP